MTTKFLIAPDFSPEHFSGWHMFNTLLQRRADLPMHLMTPSSHGEQESMLSDNDIELIYANPFDAAKLIREHGYRPLARPIGKRDEMVIVSSAKSDINHMDDITDKREQSDTLSVAMADNRDVKLIGLRLLEALDLTEADIHFEITENYQAAAKNVIQGTTDVAFFVADAFASFSKLTKMQLNVLIESDLAEISHVVLVKEGFEQASNIQKILVEFNQDEQGKSVLAELGMSDGFEVLYEEDAEFMIDLMETLLD